MTAIYDMTRRVTMHDVNSEPDYDDMDPDMKDFFTDSNQQYYTERNQYVGYS